MSLLDRDSISALILGDSHLITDFTNLEEQLQPNGIDLTLMEVRGLTSSGYIGKDPQQRLLSDSKIIAFDKHGWVRLCQGSYLIIFNEICNLPLDLMALGKPRSSLLRSGVSIDTAVWDAGYKGRSQSLLTVFNPNGFEIQQNARLLQLIFVRLETLTSIGYQGRFLNENI
ncbi:MAG: deoxyuridine 5'-triphosphate nucleotidohydrolase [Chloroflexota bacterium]|nr:deoxyuridine 5'-triphosphate nucleotidohydrolase [Chloroflexota bacterium]